MPEANVAKTLARAPLFSGLADNEMAFIARRAVPRDYAAGETIFTEGEPCQGLYVISRQARVGASQFLSVCCTSTAWVAASRRV